MNENRFASGCMFLFGLIVFLFAAGVVGFVVLDARGSVAGIIIFLVIGLVFGAVGLGIMMMARRAPQNAREANARQARHPGQPWLWREDWEQGFSQAARGGDARFVMTAMPGVLGGRLKGQVQASGLTPGAEAEFTLQCVSWRHAARNSRSSILWQDKYTAAALGMSRTLRLRADEIRGFEIRPGIQKGSEVWYEIVVRLAGERTATCPTGIDKSEAEWLVAEIRKELSANQLG